MNPSEITLSPGLYLVATPIGNARDITLRALDVLTAADVLVAEDTRTLQKLMQIHGIAREGRPLVAYHDHSGKGVVERLLEDVRQGRSVAYTSDAGSPLVSDPGHGLVAEMHKADLPLTVVPGPSAAIAALSLAGLPTDRFLFLGFPPTKMTARREWVTALADRAETMVIYESPRRVVGLLETIAEVFGATHPVVFCREITKKFETTLRGTAKEVHDVLAQTPPKGECVLLISGAVEEAADDADMESALLHAFERLSMKDAVQAVAQTLKLPRKHVYQAALELKDRSKGD